jgi:hypothetical protein
VNQENIEQYRQIHATKKYGDSSTPDVPDLAAILRPLRPKSLIDYGAGQSDTALWLGRALEMDLVTLYDPAVKGRDHFPQLLTYDVAICIDVMEHIPEEDVNEVLKIIREFTPYVVFIIHMFPAVEILPNGQNAHCTLHDVDWWLHTIRATFTFPITFIKKDWGGKRAWFKTWQD